MNELEATAARLRIEEGRRTAVYRDGRGYWTVGDGICVDGRVKGAGLTQVMCDALTRLKLEDVDAELRRRLPYWPALAPEARVALRDMAFNLGVNGLLHGFPRMMGALARGERLVAGRECRNSPKWVEDVGAARVESVAQLLEGSTTLT